QEDRADALARHQAQDLLRRIAGHADETAVEQRGAEQDANAHGVEQRHHAEAAFALAILVLRDVRDRRRKLGAMAARRARGAAGGARSIEEQAGREFARRRGSCDRRRVAQHLEPPALALPVGGDDHARRIDPELGRRLRRGIAGRAIEGERRDLGILEAVPDLLGRGAPAHRSEDDTEQVAGPVERRHLVAVAHDDHEVVAGHEAHLPQGAGDRSDLAVPLRIGAAALAIDDRLGVRLAQYRNRKCRAEIHGESTLPGLARARFPTRALRGPLLIGQVYRRRGRRGNCAAVRRIKEGGTRNGRSVAPLARAGNPDVFRFAEAVLPRLIALGVLPRLIALGIPLIDRQGGLADSGLARPEADQVRLVVLVVPQAIGLQRALAWCQQAIIECRDRIGIAFDELRTGAGKRYGGNGDTGDSDGNNCATNSLSHSAPSHNTYWHDE